MDIKPSKKRVTSKANILTPGNTKNSNILSVSPVSKSGHKSRKKKLISKKLMIRYSLVFGNLLVIGLVGLLIISSSGNNAANYSTSNDNFSNRSPLDEISAADVAVNIARMTDLPEANSVVNYADTINSELQTFTVDTDVVKMPQILSANIKTLADIKEYITVPGDSVPILAERFAVTSDSIKWSNDLTGDSLSPGTKLLIPPMNGMIYTIRSGDNPQKVAQLYGISVEQVVVFNDLEVTGMIPGKRIFLPNAQRPTPAASFAVRYGNNGYDAGWCTYYAAARGGAPGGWGHARTWAVNAARTPGWFVSKVPVPGAIAQTTGISGDRVGGSWGHVGVVEQVKEENGQYYIKYSDMNGLAGFNRVGHSDWVPALSKYQNFIYRVQ